MCAKWRRQPDQTHRGADQNQPENRGPLGAPAKKTLLPQPDACLRETGQKGRSGRHAAAAG